MPSTFSLWKEGKNIITDSEGEYGISKMGNQFIAGILHQLPVLMAITTLILIVGYASRLDRCFPVLGIDNREAAIRVIKEPDGEIRNFELKTVDASSNPYLALGAVITAGLHGIKQEIELENPVQVDPADIFENNPEYINVNRLPSN